MSSSCPANDLAAAASPISSGSASDEERRRCRKKLGAQQIAAAVARKRLRQRISKHRSPKKPKTLGLITPHADDNEPSVPRKEYKKALQGK